MFAIPLSIVLYITVLVFGIKIFMYTNEDIKRVIKVRMVSLSGFVAVIILFAVGSFVIYDSGNIDNALAVLFMWIWFFPAVIIVMWVAIWKWLCGRN